MFRGFPCLLPKSRGQNWLMCRQYDTSALLSYLAYNRKRLYQAEAYLVGFAQESQPWKLGRSSPWLVRRRVDNIEYRQLPTVGDKLVTSNRQIRFPLSAGTATSKLDKTQGAAPAHAPPLNRKCCLDEIVAFLASAIPPFSMTHSHVDACSSSSIGM